MASSFEFRVFVDKSLGCDKMRRLELLYDTISKYNIDGGIPIFWMGQERYNASAEDDPLLDCDLPAKNSTFLNHLISCSMIQIDKNGNERLVPFTISGLNYSISSTVDNSSLFVNSQIISPNIVNNLRICITNISNENITLERGIAYACVYGPNLLKTPKIVLVNDINDLSCKKNVTNNRLRLEQEAMIVYNAENAAEFKAFAMEEEINNLKKSGHKFYNGYPKW